MSDNKCSCFGAGTGVSAKETICIDTYRVLDSCRDRDCYEDVRVYLSPIGQEIINRTCSVRTKYACILWTYVGVDPVQFNRGFYQVTIRTYIKIVLEACVCAGRLQEFEGLAVVEKRVILYGSEGSVNVYRSSLCDNFCAPHDTCEGGSNLPVAVVEIATPVLLGVKVVEPTCVCACYTCGCFDDIPEGVRQAFAGDLTDDDQCNRLYASIGIFSVIRIERPAQYLITASDYSVPDKECIMTEEDDACSLFRSMAFPVQEFSPPALSSGTRTDNCGCGGNNKKDGCGR